MFAGRGRLRQGRHGLPLNPGKPTGARTALPAATIPKIERIPMIFRKLLLCCAGVLVAGQAAAQVELKTYADRNGYVDVQKLTCAQLANTFQEDADYLTVWYSGWYNGLAKKHMMKVDRAKALEHEVIVHCKANPGKKVIEAIDVVFKDYRTDQGIKMKK
jgi:hypothetical protein